MRKELRTEKTYGKSRSKLFFEFIVAVLIVISFSCDDELVGTKTPINPPSTEIINVPPENSVDNPYMPIMTISFKGISNGGIIKGFYISYKSYFLERNDSVITAPYYVSETSQLIAFPSADSVNKQVLTVQAVDNYGNVDPLGATKIYFTSKTYPPETAIIFPTDTMSFYVGSEVTPSWQGVKIAFTAENRQGEIDGFSVKIDEGEWSPWQEDTVFYLNPLTVPNLSAGLHKVTVTSRNNAYVEDKTPPSIYVNLIFPTHEKDWLVIDDTKDQNGSREHPSDEQVDNFYEAIFEGIDHDVWDIAARGAIPKNELGKYKFVLWHCDAKANSRLSESVGLLTDFLNTGGRLMISGWDFYDTFSQTGVWRDSIKFFGNFLKDYLHIENQYTITEALLDSIVVLDDDYFLTDIAAVDTSKIWSFRDGLFYVNWFYSLGAFTNRLFLYHPADSVAGENYIDAVIGFGYHNREYQLVVLGFPLYYLTESDGKTVFLRAKEYIEKDFPF
jgi:hypothetical protein